MSLIEEKSMVNLQFDSLDDDHHCFAELVNRLEHASKQDFAKLFEQLFNHTQRHFDKENQLMLDTSFPAIQEHKAEHQRVLTEFKQFKKSVDKGLISFGQSFIKERLPSWFQMHLVTMDSALVAHIKCVTTLQPL